jgi:16S rRNA (uracil1498-N3)-methyltransferase
MEKMNVFYAPGLNESDISCTLDSDESNHCLRAMRRATGQSITLTNGCGLFADGIISAVESGKCIVDISEIRKETAKRWNLELAVAPTKNMNRFEWFTEKATEIGVDTIYPLICEHAERTHIQHDRINRLLVAAMKQSLKSYLPVLMPEIRFSDLIKKEFPGQKFIAWCGDEKILPLKDVIEKEKKILILIGPEGDFSIDEIDLALKNGFIPISLGKNRLRTETAAMVACHIANLIND